MHKSKYWLIPALILTLFAACSPIPAPEDTIGSQQADVETQTLPPPNIITNSELPTESPSPTLTPTITPTFVVPEPPQQTFPDSYFGAEIHPIGDLSILQLAVEAGVELIRYNGVIWHEIEPEPGVRNWTMLGDLERGLEYLSENNIPAIVIIRGVPLFAQKTTGYYCGQIAEEYFPAYTQFLSELVQRYSQPPYNVKYWELGNEPDVDYTLVQVDSPFGCMGDAAAADYGGSYYAELLKVAYPTIKAADPQAQVLIGGLLLDCDPTNPPESKTCQPANYLEGILANGGGDYFDIVSFHGYPQYSNGHAVDEEFFTWDNRGGVIIGKADFLREILAKYGFEKPLFHTEGSLICPGWNTRECEPPLALYYTTQAQFLPRMYLRNWAYGITGTIWYSFEGEGWRGGGMVGNPTNPKLTFLAFRYLTDTFGDAEFIGILDEGPGIITYRFRTGDTEIRSVWSLDWQPRTISLPDGVTRITDIYGNPVSVETNQLLVDGVYYLFFENP